MSGAFLHRRVINVLLITAIVVMLGGGVWYRMETKVPGSSYRAQSVYHCIPTGRVCALNCFTGTYQLHSSNCGQGEYCNFEGEACVNDPMLPNPRPSQCCIGTSTSASAASSPSSSPGAHCGDGIVDTVNNEECDDGNEVDTDECTNSCTNSRCGDGIVDTVNNEECDDGNEVDTDECTNSCTNSICGDGILYAVDEECDDGNEVDTDECTNSCTKSICGDGILYAVDEECDDGNTVGGDSCTADCTFPGCCMKENDRFTGVCSMNEGPTCIPNGNKTTYNCTPNLCPRCLAPGECMNYSIDPEGIGHCPDGNVEVPDSSCWSFDQYCCEPLHQCVYTNVQNESVTTDCKESCNPACEDALHAPPSSCDPGVCCAPKLCEDQTYKSVCGASHVGCFGYGIKYGSSMDLTAVANCFTSVREKTFPDGHKEIISGSLFGCTPPASGVTYLFDVPCKTEDALQCNDGCATSVKKAIFTPMGQAVYPGHFINTMHVWGTCTYTTECGLDPSCSTP